MIRSFLNIGRAFARLAVSVATAFADFGRDLACAFKGCDGTDGSCCR